MRFLVLLLVESSLFVTGESAEPWKLEADANLTLTQNAYSDNWVGGEAVSISRAFNSNWLAERKFSMQASGSRRSFSTRAIPGSTSSSTTRRSIRPVQADPGSRADIQAAVAYNIAAAAIGGANGS